MIPTSHRSPINQIVSVSTVLVIALVACVTTGLLAVPLTGNLAGTAASAARPEVATADDLPIAAAEDVGMSAERLQRIEEVIERAIDAKQISGAVTLVVREGKVPHFEAHGMMDVEAGHPMEKDTIFQIASMTKPVTGVAFLMLMEEGKVRLSDPVSKFIPEFQDTQVAIAKPDSDDDQSDIYTVPSNREISVRDLLTHTSGLVSGGVGSREASRIAPRRSNDNLATYTAELGAAPLDFQPGSRWAYSGLAGIDTVARIVEVVSGFTFDEFLRQRIFEPLGMLDTSFNVAGDRASRVVTRYERTPTGLERRGVPWWVDTVTLFGGGVGLWSTAGDYAKFAQMLVNRGRLNGVQILGSKTVELMASNHVGDLYAVTGRTGGRVGKGFGLTVDVVLDAVAAQDNRSTGSFGWTGALGTAFWVDWREEMAGILMVQTPGGQLRADFQNAVRQAIVD